jgi:hypothetical protein
MLAVLPANGMHSVVSKHLGSVSITACTCTGQPGMYHWLQATGLDQIRFLCLPLDLLFRIRPFLYDQELLFGCFTGGCSLVTALTTLVSVIGTMCASIASKGLWSGIVSVCVTAQAVEIVLPESNITGQSIWTQVFAGAPRTSALLAPDRHRLYAKTAHADIFKTLLLRLRHL